MNISFQIEAVYRRALLLRQYATQLPVKQELLDKALDELYFVLEELQTSQEELQNNNQELLATQQILEREQQRYQALFKLAPSAYFVTDRQGKIYQANRSAVDLLGIPHEYLIEKPLVVFIHPNDRPQFLYRLTKLDSASTLEISLNPRHQKMTTVEISTAIVGDAYGKEIVLWSLHDITDRLHMEQQLQSAQLELERRVEVRTAELWEIVQQLQQEIEERQQAEGKIREQAALIDIASDAIFVQDLAGRIVFWSQGAERLYGWTAEQAMGKTANELLYQQPPQQMTADLNHTLELGTWQAELEQVTQAGKPIAVASRWTLMRNELGEPQSILIVNTDITEKKQRELEVERARRLEILGNLAREISHDLKNVFAPILLTAQDRLMRSPPLDSSLYKSWKLVETSAYFGMDLVQQMLQFAKGEELPKVSLQIQDVLIEITQTLQRTFPKSIRICLENPSQTLDAVSANPTQLQQIVMNLCINARDAMPDGGTLRIGAHNRSIGALEAQGHLNAHQGNYVMISISDTGTGIPASLHDRIFEPFFSTKEPGQGTGLGLSAVLNLTKHQGGFVEFGSQEGKGTCFRVSLPSATSD